MSFWVPDYICPTAWIEHAPFAFWICEALRPCRFIELGTHYGYSYFAFCQAIDRLRLGTTAYAIDTWEGDEHTGFYDESAFQSVVARNNQKYSAFSCLIRSTFEGALDYFADGSVDLLHIDGRHFYDDVKNDFAIWRPKLTEDAVVLFHDTNVREREFGVWKFFEEVAAQYPSFQFFHGHGLGVLMPGDRVRAPLTSLIKASRETADQIRVVYAALGSALTARAALGERAAAGEAMQAEIGSLRDALAGAQQEARQCAAAGEAMQAEITSLGSELAVAREVGRAVLAALRTEHATVPEAPRDTGWLTPVLRVFGFPARYQMPSAG